MVISPDSPENITLETVLETESLADFEAKIDEFDEAGRGKKFETGCIFTLQFGKRIEHIRVTGIDEATNTIHIRAYDGTAISTTWGEFIEVISDSNSEFHRLGKLDSLQDFGDNAYLSKPLTTDHNSSNTINAIQPDIFCKNGKIQMHVKEPKEMDVEVWGFKNPKKSAFLEVNFQHGRPIVKETYYSTTQQEIDAGKMEKNQVNKGDDLKTVKKRIVKHNEIDSYEGLLQFMADYDYFMPVHKVNSKGEPGGSINPIKQHEKQEAQSHKNPINSDIKYERPGILSTISNMTTIGDILLMGKMAKKSIEHSMESR